MGLLIVLKKYFRVLFLFKKCYFLREFYFFFSCNKVFQITFKVDFFLCVGWMPQYRWGQFSFGIFTTDGHDGERKTVEIFEWPLVDCLWINWNFCCSCFYSFIEKIAVEFFSVIEIERERNLWRFYWQRDFK